MGYVFGKERILLLKKCTCLLREHIIWIDFSLMHYVWNKSNNIKKKNDALVIYKNVIFFFFQFRALTTIAYIYIYKQSLATNRFIVMGQKVHVD